MRVARLLAAGEAHPGPVVGTLILTLEQRQAARGTLAAVNGISVEFTQPLRLRADDRLLLDDGTLVEVVAEPESLVEVRAGDLAALARLAWHLGDRHIPVQIFANRLRLRRDGVVEALLAKLGGKLTAIEAPFEPEGGAYDSAHMHDEHSHEHGHDHTRHDHDHSHDQDHAHHGHHDHKHHTGGDR
jgi:urease accessory protein